MDVGVIFPGLIRTLDPTRIVDWAQASEDLGFSTFAVTDRPSWTTPDPLTTLSAAAAVTRRIRLMTSILQAPLRSNPVLFANQVSAVDGIAGAGRLTIGLSPGGRETDYEGSGVDFHRRGAIFDQWLTQYRAAMDGAYGPAPVTVGGPPLLFGGFVPAAIRRVVTVGAGWIGAHSEPEKLAPFLDGIREARAAADKSAPRFVVCQSISLDPQPADPAAGLAGVEAYYSDLGPQFAGFAVAGTLTSPELLRERIEGWSAVGVDELLLAVNDPDPAGLTRIRAELSN
ncbi:MAG TPA: LLM class flavin-dependent oxidoreductase [Pseudolysinimonas sp.]|nr:LLM class flavin-dependent oxidoreductase [Pseudolysinimonas sp.]